MLKIEKQEGEVFKLVSLVQNECTGIKLEEILESIKQNTRDIQASKEESRSRLLAWVNGVDTRNTYQTALHNHHEGTCDWALQLQEFRVWQDLDLSEAGLLWIHGPAGFGKTFMSAWIIQILKETSHRPVCFFFCVADNQSTRDPYAILRSWLTQVLEQDDAVIAVMNAFFTLRNNGRTLTHLELWELFISVVEATPGCTFVVDGFDECTDIDAGVAYHRNEPRSHFLRSMLKNLSKSKFRVLVVSRDVPDIREILGKSSAPRSNVNLFEYQITAKDTTADVQSFSEFVVNGKLPGKPPALRQKIADQAAKRSEGMFLWIRLLENEILPEDNARMLTDTVQEMPSGISEAYSRELEKIAHLPPKRKGIAVMILRWVLFAVRPLLVKELAEALVVSDDDLGKYPDGDLLPDSWKDGFVDERYVNGVILGRCGSLLQLRSETSGTPLSDHTVHFVHFSVKEYIWNLSNDSGNSPWVASLGLSNATIEEIRLSKICLRYLTLDVFEEIPPDTSRYPFLSYAAWAWYFHSFHRKPTPPSQDILQRTRKAFDPTVSSWKVWAPVMESQLAGPDKEWEKLIKRELNSTTDDKGSKRSATEDSKERPLTTIVHDPIYYASLLGLVDVVKWLEQQGLDCNCMGGRFGFPLQAAVARNQNVVVKYLLNRNANILAKGGLYGSAIIAAAALSSSEMVDILLDAGADLTVVDQAGWTPLHHAARRGSPAITKCLLDHGAHIDSVTITGATAACLACGHGQKEILSILIERGANFGLATKNGVLPFENALYYSHKDLALMLLDTKTPANNVTLYGSTPLHLAIRARSLEVVKKLLDKQVDTSLLDKRNWTALQLAAAVGDVDIVEAILNAGADVAFSHLETLPPVQLAAANNHMPVMKLLCERGANLNQTTSRGVNALIVALERNSQEAVEALLDMKASIKYIREHTQETLFDVALRSRHDNLVRLLIARGCFSEPGQTNTAKRDGSCNASTDDEDDLAVLSFAGTNETVKKYLEGRCNSPTTADLNEALHAASARGEKAIVQLLLDQGASVNAKDINGRTALHYAVMRIKKDVVDVLLEHGASVSMEDDIGSTPIDLAVSRGVKSIDFIKKHMNDLERGISRRPSLLSAISEQGKTLSSLAIRDAISGSWKGFLEHLCWDTGRPRAFSIKVPPMQPDIATPSTFSSEDEQDEVGSFQYHGFVDRIGIIWFVKLYKEHGWLYQGRLDADTRTLKGKWGSNRKLWFGTFQLSLEN